MKLSFSVVALGELVDLEVMAASAFLPNLAAKVAAVESRVFSRSQGNRNAAPARRLRLGCLALIVLFIFVVAHRPRSNGSQREARILSAKAG